MTFITRWTYQTRNLFLKYPVYNDQYEVKQIHTHRSHRHCAVCLVRTHKYITSQKECKNSWPKYCFWTKKVKPQWQQNKHKYTCQIRELNTGSFAQLSKAFTSSPQRQLEVSIEAELFYCCNVMGRNKKHKPKFAGHTFSKRCFL